MMFHLGWFLPGWGIQNSVFNGWTPSLSGAWAGSHEREWMRPDLYVDLATALERGGFDFLLLEDTSQVDNTFRGSTEASLRLGLFAPKNDPLPLVPLLAARTRHLGIVPTLSSSFYPPYLAARLLTTLDHISEGRVGYNV
ncbi:MAG: LLM class flavin-dependent oxidoreductase, partial [Burkholderiaceae bacterium]|nr:LLM class flavin-dependent oxidoreductase [Burkholderiaceae bacterium]